MGGRRAARGEPLTIVHAIGIEQAAYLVHDPEQRILGTARSMLDDAAGLVARTHPRVTVSTVLSRAEPAESLLEAAAGGGTIVVGSRGLGGFAALLVGSVGLRVAARAHGPVVVVRDGASAPTQVVLVAVRDDGDRDTLRFAARTALARGASLWVMSVWRFLENVGSMVTMVDDVSELARAEADATTGTVTPIRAEYPELAISEETVRAVSVAGQLAEASRRADLLVVGARRPAHTIGSPLGRVAHALLQHAHCPVAVVPR
ncbi:universal stress protein [Streptomyces sp. NPDC093085]|uniref:universal stress protein n=1 Tax=Streptomyces sp. NPDC093085 TaxID=3155068 RepID=UPI00342B08F6